MMKLFLRLCTITCKKAWKSFPLLFAGAVVLLGLISTIAFFCMKLSGKEQSFAQVTIGVAFLDTPTDSSALADNTYFHTLLSFIGDMQSTRDYFDFTLMDKSDAHAQLASGDIAALLLIPSDVLSSILDGSNHSIQVIFPHTSDFSSTILQELTRSGAHMLGTAQSGIYTIHDLYQSLQCAELHQSYCNIYQ